METTTAKIQNPSDDGFILLHRKALQKGWLKNHKLWVFWTWCLLKASHKNHIQIIGYQEIQLLPGQFIFGRKKAAAELGMTEREVRTVLYSLVTMGNVTIKTTNKYSIISIINWSTYQHPANSKRPPKRQTNDQQRSTDNNGNNENKEKNIYGDFVLMTDVEYQKLLQRFGEQKTRDWIETLNNGIGSKGYKYKSHYHTILSWERNKKSEVKKPLGDLSY